MLVIGTSIRNPQVHASQICLVFGWLAGTTAKLGSRESTLAVAAAYSTTHNAKRMALDFAKAVKSGLLKSKDITANLIDQYLAQNEGPETQLWYRSGGEVRFSEFLVLQNGYSYIHIDRTLSPAVQSWNLVWSIVLFQIYWPKIRMVKERHRNLSKARSDRQNLAQVLRQRTFLINNEMARITALQRFSVTA